MDVPIYDIVVIGAGPAGSCAARAAAEAGVRVLLMERHRQVGIPLSCAEGIGREGLSFIQNKVRPRWISSEVEGCIMTAPSGRSCHIHFPEAGYVLERKVFDRDLAILAVEAGADLWIGAHALGLVCNNGAITGVKVRRNGVCLDVPCTIVIGADGTKSSVGRWAHIPVRLTGNHIQACAQYLLAGVKVEEGYPEFIAGNQIAPGGYAWIFPKGKNHANVGLGLVPPLATARPREYLDALVKRRFPQSSVIESMTGVVPAAYLSQVVGDGVLLAGDAARVSDPISGAGIANAIVSGRLAGEVAADAIRGGSVSRRSLAEYQRRLHRACGRDIHIRARAREVYLKLTDDDLESIFDFTERTFGGKTLEDIQPYKIIVSLIKSSPRLLKLGRHLLPLFGA